MLLLISPKHVYATKRLKIEAKKTGLELETVDVKDLAKRKFKVNIKKYQVLYIRQSYPFNKEVVSLAKLFQAKGKRVIDANITQGDLGLGKFDMYERLQKQAFLIPKTECFHPNSLILNLKSKIIKWNYGFAGKGTFLVKDGSKVEKITKVYPKKELLVQEFIPADYEYKVITVGFKALPVVLRLKIKDSGFMPDLNKFEVIKTAVSSPVKKAIALAEKSSRTLGRELAKVDILQAGNKFYILEVNRWPGLSFFEQKTGFNVAREFVKYLKSHGLP